VNEERHFDGKAVVSIVMYSRGDDWNRILM